MVKKNIVFSKFSALLLAFLATVTLIVISFSHSFLQNENRLIHIVTEQPQTPDMIAQETIETDFISLTFSLTKDDEAGKAAASTCYKIALELNNISDTQYSCRIRRGEYSSSVVPYIDPEAVYGENYSVGVSGWHNDSAQCSFVPKSKASHSREIGAMTASYLVNQRDATEGTIGYIVEICSPRSNRNVLTFVHEVSFPIPESQFSQQPERESLPGSLFSSIPTDLNTTPRR